MFLQAYAPKGKVLIFLSNGIPTVDDATLAEI
jgi:hypothetical protein